MPPGALLPCVFIWEDPEPQATLGEPPPTPAEVPVEALSERTTFKPLSAVNSSDLRGARRYTRHILKNALQLMGCKPQHSHYITEAVFDALAEEGLRRGSIGEPIEGGYCACTNRPQFLSVVQAALCKHQYVKARHLQDFVIACDIKERKRSIVLLFGGTSGCGKSTLASLLASRLGVTTVLSTDSIRHMLRNFIAQEECPVLYASTYDAGEALVGSELELMTPKKRLLCGYKAQNEMVFSKLAALIDACERRNESVIIEGVHCSVELVVELMRRHPNCIPFIVFISNENKHKERFAVRSKYMTLDPRLNKYAKHFASIRTIQKYLCKQADRFLIPKIDNTNIDRSVATVHSIVRTCLRKLAQGGKLYDADLDKATILHHKYQKELKQLWSSKAMLSRIRSKAQLKGGASTPTGQRTADGAGPPSPAAAAAYSGGSGPSHALSRPRPPRVASVSPRDLPPPAPAPPASHDRPRPPALAPSPPAPALEPAAAPGPAPPPPAEPPSGAPPDASPSPPPAAGGERPGAPPGGPRRRRAESTGSARGAGRAGAAREDDGLYDDERETEDGEGGGRSGGGEGDENEDAVGSVDEIEAEEGPGPARLRGAAAGAPDRDLLRLAAANATAARAARPKAGAGAPPAAVGFAALLLQTAPAPAGRSRGARLAPPPPPAGPRAAHDSEPEAGEEAPGGRAGLLLAPAGRGSPPGEGAAAASEEWTAGGYTNAEAESDTNPSASEEAPSPSEDPSQRHRGPPPPTLPLRCGSSAGARPS